MELCWLMPWVRIDDAFYDHPKFDRAGPLGVALWVVGLAWSNRNLTDGFIPDSKVRTLIDWTGIAWRLWSSDAGFGGGTDAEAVDVADHLVECDLLERVEGGYLIANFHDYQPSAAEVRKKQQDIAAVRSDAGRKGAEARWNGKPDGNGDGSAMANRMANLQQSDAPNPVPQEISLSSSSDSRGCGPQPVDDDDRLEQVWDHLADLKLAVAKSVSNPTGWKRKVARNARLEQAAEARDLLAHYPSITTSQLAGVLAGNRSILRHLPRVS